MKRIKHIQKILRGYIGESSNDTVELEKYRGYLQDWGNVRLILKGLIKTVGDFPTQNQMVEQGYSSLAAAIPRYWGSMNNVRQKMGFQPNQRTRGYWMDFANVEKELRKIIKKIGHFPTQRYLWEHGKKDLVSAIGKNYGWANVRERMGGEAYVKPKGYWMEWEHVAEALQEMIQKYEHFPSYNNFKNSKYSALPRAIKKHHGGMDSVLEKMGYTRAHTPSGYWKDFSHIRKVLENLEEKLGHFPTQKEICDAGYAGVPSAISEYHGGLGKIALRLGKKTKQRIQGYWTLTNVKHLCRAFVDEFGHFPSQQELSEQEDDKYRGLIGGVNKHGGLQRIQRLVGLENPNQKPIGFWNKKTVFQEAKKLIRKFGKLPTQVELNKKGYTQFVGAASKHASFTELRREFHLEVEKRENGYWTEEQIITEAKKVVKKHGDLLTKDELFKLGYGALASKIEKNGGYPYWRQKLGIKLKYRPRGYWTEEHTYIEAKSLYETLGRLPSQKELSKLKISTLIRAAEKHYGGLAKLRDLIEQEKAPQNKQQLENLLTVYAGNSITK